MATGVARQWATTCLRTLGVQASSTPTLSRAGVQLDAISSSRNSSAPYEPCQPSTSYSEGALPADQRCIVPAASGTGRQQQLKPRSSWTTMLSGTAASASSGLLASVPAWMGTKARAVCQTMPIVPCRAFAAYTASVPAPDKLKQIDPNSSWLTHYRKDIHPRQLTYRVSKRIKLQELRDGMVLYKHKVDALAASAFLTQIIRSMKYDTSFDVKAADELIAHCMDRLKKHLRFSNLESISAAMWAMAKMQSAFLKHASLAKPKLAFGDELLLEMLAKATNNRQTMLEAPPRQFCALVWAASKLLSTKSSHPVVQHALDKVALCSIKRLQNFGPVELAIMAEAYTRLGPKLSSAQLKAAAPNVSEAALTDAVAAELPRGFTERHLSAPTPEVDVSAGQKRNHRLLAAIAAEVVARVGNLAHEQPRPRQLAQLATAFALNNWALPELLAAVARGAQAQVHAFVAADWVMLTEALAVMGAREASLLAAAEDHLRRHTKSYAEDDKKKLLTALSALGVSVPIL